MQEGTFKITINIKSNPVLIKFCWILWDCVLLYLQVVVDHPKWATWRTALSTSSSHRKSLRWRSPMTPCWVFTLPGAFAEHAQRSATLVCGDDLAFCTAWVGCVCVCKALSFTGPVSERQSRSSLYVSPSLICASCYFMWRSPTGEDAVVLIAFC